MSRKNRFGLVIWFVVVVSVVIHPPIDTMFNFLCFVFLAITGSVCLLTPNAGDLATTCPNYQGIGDDECYTCKHSPANTPTP